MKSIRGLAIVLIGMISMTVFATTSEPGQKSKPTIVHESHVSDVVNVETPVVATANVFVIKLEHAVSLFGNSGSSNLTAKISKAFATVDDVGWTPEKKTLAIKNIERLKYGLASRLGPVQKYRCYRCSC